MEHQIHFGKKFYQDKQKGYWISICCPKIRAHRWVWNNIHGMIPKGYHIHHKNEDKSDNRIENLELIDGSRHYSYHMQKNLKDPTFIKKLVDNCDRIRPMTKVWHASPEGKAWHRAHGILEWSKRQPREFTCKNCLKIFFSKTFHQEFCSNACKSKWRRHQKIDNVIKICPTCKNEFSSNKYIKQIFCKKSCKRKI